jgi:hypothetical protein
MRKPQDYDHGECKYCGGPFVRKPAQKQFCKPRCRYRYHNTGRGRVTEASALKWIGDHLLTIRQAANLTNSEEAQIRSLTRSGRLNPIRLFGRVLVRRRDRETSNGYSPDVK